MLQKRFDQEHDENTQPTPTLSASESLRTGTASGASPTHDPKDDDKISIFWRVFGGTLLSIVALVAVTLYNTLNSGISDLRAELTREREARLTFARKDEVEAHLKTQYERIRTVEGYKADIETMKERLSTSIAAIESNRKEVGGSIDGLRKETAGIDVLKERLAGMAAELKLAREEVQRLQQEVEKTKIAELERKATRDAQAKSLEDTIKELQRGLQSCREKLARLEGPQPPAPRTGAPEAKGPPPAGTKSIPGGPDDE